MLIQNKSQLKLGAHAVRTRQKLGLFHIFKALHGKCPGKASDAAQHLRTQSLLYILFHQLHRLIARFNVHSSLFVIHFLTPFLRCLKQAYLPAHNKHASSHL